MLCFWDNSSRESFFIEYIAVRTNAILYVMLVMPKHNYSLFHINFIRWKWREKRGRRRICSHHSTTPAAANEAGIPFENFKRNEGKRHHYAPKDNNFHSSGADPRADLLAFMKRQVQLIHSKREREREREVDWKEFTLHKLCARIIIIKNYYVRVFVRKFSLPVALTPSASFGL